MRKLLFALFKLAVFIAIASLIFFIIMYIASPNMGWHQYTYGECFFIVFIVILVNFIIGKLFDKIFDNKW